MTFSPVDNELLLSEMDMMEVYGGSGDGEESNTYCHGARCSPDCGNKNGICTGNNDVKTPACGGFGGGNGSGSGSGNGSGSGSGKGK